MNFNFKRLKAERIAKGFTQEQIAEKLGIKRSSYAKRENGLVSIGADELAIVAEVLDLQDNIQIFFTFNVDKLERIENKPRS